MHLIWDWNGTLFDDLHIVVDAVNASLAAIGIDMTIDADDYRDHYQRPVRAFYDAMLERPITDEQWATVNVRFHDVYMNLVPQARPTVDALGATTEVSRRGLTQSILSMWSHTLLGPTVDRYGLGAAMLAVRGSDDARGEPKADLLRRHLAELNINGDQKVVMVGDTFDDAAAASAVGIRCVFYDGGSHHREDLEKTGVPVAGSLIEALEIARGL